MSIGWEVHFFREVSSTNDIARELALRSKEGTVVVAQKQTKGKGRIGRRWSSPQGGLWMSVILKPRIPAGTYPLLNLIAATAVAESLSALQLEARTRWPNDVVVATKKIAGVLAETGFDAARTVVLGVGVNTNVKLSLLPESFRNRATSVQTLLNREVSNDRLMRSICRAIERDYERVQQGAVTDLLRDWKRLSTTLGRRVEVVGANGAVRGFARDIRRDGALLVETEAGEVVTVLAGECRMVT